MYMGKAPQSKASATDLHHNLLSPVVKESKTKSKRERKSSTAYKGGIKNGSNLYDHPLPSSYAASLVIHSWF
ncbi:hypothetical protein CFP56_008005 [Quercus suber]|uniref:Uncharacterized protein n=1 Tax=Quercus suber TaxID=58331 RepID=A0AAW0L6Q3_QUESU